jgi:hypothetical protein
MRKLVLFCLALALAATSVPAMAQSKIDFSGYLKVFHENLHNFSRTGVNNNRDNDSFFENKLQVNLEIQPNDDISIFWTFRSMNYARWGAVPAGSGGSPAGPADFFTRWLYAEVRQPWGTLQIGRLADGLGSNAGGLASLGYTPGWGSEFLYVMPFDIDGPTDSIVYSYDFGNGFVLAAFYAKDNIDQFAGNPALIPGFDITTNPANLLHVAPTPRQRKDADRDRFGIEPRYQWDTGGVSLGVVYIRDKGYDSQWESDPPTVPATWLGESVKDAWEININPAVTQSWGPFSIHFEGVVAFGKYKIQEWQINPLTGTFDEFEFKNNGLGLYLDASYNYGAGDITLMSWFADGTSFEDTNRDNVTLHSSVGMGDFAPFLVAYNGITLGTGTWTNSVADGFGLNNFGGDVGYFDAGNTNHWGIGLLGNHSINDDIKLNYGLGYFRLVSLPFDTSAVLDNRANRSKSLGFEIDLGATFQILDNLSFETQFGYMFNGSAYRASSYVADGAGGVVAVYGPKPKDTFAWANVLAVTF